MMMMWCMLYSYTRQSMHTRLSLRKTRTEWICALSAVWHELPEQCQLSLAHNCS